MSKKMKVLIAVLVAIITLTVSGTVAVLAQDEDEPEPDEEALIGEQDEVTPRLFTTSIGSGELLSRVAEILGITEEELRDAFAQARQEILAERGEKAFYEFLDRAVEEGLITDDEAAEIREWWEQKPEALNWALLRQAFFMMRLHPEALANNGGKEFKGIKRNIQQRLKEGAEPELRLEMLEKAIEEGLITEDEAAEIKAWAGNKPAVLSQLAPKPRIMNAVRGRQMIAVPEGGARAATLPEYRLN